MKLSGDNMKSHESRVKLARNWGMGEKFMGERGKAFPSIFSPKMADMGERGKRGEKGFSYIFQRVNWGQGGQINIPPFLWIFRVKITLIYIPKK